VSADAGGAGVSEDEENDFGISEDEENGNISSSQSPPPYGDVQQHVGVRTRLQKGIRNPKKYTDGTVRYGMFSSTGEPSTLVEAQSDSKWQQAM
jgi:hypothetical protein